jgi:hypothetical protein
MLYFSLHAMTFISPNLQIVSKWALFFAKKLVITRFLVTFAANLSPRSLRGITKNKNKC